MSTCFKEGDAIRYFVGGLSPTIQGEKLSIDGDVLFSAHFDPSRDGLYGLDFSKTNLFLDSGAFQRIKEGTRIPNSESLDLQLRREQQLSEKTGRNVQAIAIASNDRLIDEKWINDRKVKQRWSVEEGWLAVDQTVAAARYLSSQRSALGSRTLVLGCQGVDAAQYKICVERVLEHATDRDWIGLGGWCILGKQQKWMPTFRQTLIEAIPVIARSSVSHVHIYGVMFEPALGNLLWMCDRFGLTCSTDSKKALSDCRWKTPEQRIKAGARRHYYQDNVTYWKEHLKGFRSTRFYQSPYVGSISFYKAKQNNFQLGLALV